MVEHGQPLCARRLAQLHALLPGRMAEAAPVVHFLSMIGAVVDDQVGLLDERKHIRIQLAVHMLRVA